MCGRAYVCGRLCVCVRVCARVCVCGRECVAAWAGVGHSMCVEGVRHKASGMLAAGPISGQLTSLQALSLNMYHWLASSCANAT